MHSSFALASKKHLFGFPDWSGPVRSLNFIGNFTERRMLARSLPTKAETGLVNQTRTNIGQTLYEARPSNKSRFTSLLSFGGGRQLQFSMEFLSSIFLGQTQSKLKGRVFGANFFCSLFRRSRGSSTNLNSFLETRPGYSLQPTIRYSSPLLST